MFDIGLNFERENGEIFWGYLVNIVWSEWVGWLWWVCIYLLDGIVMVINMNEIFFVLWSIDW